MQQASKRVSTRSMRCTAASSAVSWSSRYACIRVLASSVAHVTCWETDELSWCSLLGVGDAPALEGDMHSHGHAAFRCSVCGMGFVGHQVAASV